MRQNAYRSKRRTREGMRIEYDLQVGTSIGPVCCGSTSASSRVLSCRRTCLCAGCCIELDAIDLAPPSLLLPSKEKLLLLLNFHPTCAPYRAELEYFG